MPHSDTSAGSTFGPDSATARLATALRLSLAFRSAGRSDAREFLAEHAELADLLEPMIAPADPNLDAEADGDAEPVGAEPTAVPAADGRTPQAIGDYRIEREIGRGGMGVVYAAIQVSLHRRVALKLIAPGAVSERMQRRFVREAAILGRLDHEHIVRVLDAGVTEHGAFLALELIDGASFAVVLDAVRRAGLSAATGATVSAALVGALPDPGAGGAHDPLRVTPVVDPFQGRGYVDTVVLLLAQIADALSCAHAARVIHRDVKPSNILVRRDGRAVLSDFGVARDEGSGDASQSNPLAGTPSSMAPEQVSGAAIDERTDVYGLGATLYEALTLTPPFTGGAVAMLEQIRNDDPADPRRHHPTLPQDLVAILGRAMAKAPAERYASAADLADDLRAFLARAPVAARPPSAWRRLRRAVSKRPWRAVAYGSAALAVSLALLVAGIYSLRIAAETSRKNLALAEVERLGMNIALDETLAAATVLTAARSEAVGEMTAWLDDRAQPLVAELPQLDVLLASVRARAEPYTPADADADRSTHPEAETLERLDLEVELATPAHTPARTADALRDAQVRQAAVAARVASRRTWRFREAETQFLHDQVAALRARLLALSAPDGAMTAMRAQREFVRYAHQRSLVDGSAAWATAIAAIAGDPRYGGLRLRADEDLLPLGRDPHSGLWEFVHLRSGVRGREVPARSADGSMVPDGDMGIVLVLLPPGAFAMGAQRSDTAAANHDPAAGPYEAPVQVVTLDAFCIGKYETTNGQWQRLTGAESGPWRVGDVVQGEKITPRHPAVNISHTQATAVLAAHGLSLPSEAQWEYACRAGTDSPWSFGDRSRAPSHANFADAASQAITLEFDIDLHDGFALLAPVGTFAANAFGLHDVHGNVSEWSASRICNFAERPARPGDGERESFLFDELRFVTRGGSHVDPLASARSANRWAHAAPDERSPGRGVRVGRRIRGER